MSDELPTASANRELTAKIVAAYVQGNQIGADQVASLISTVQEALAGLGRPEEPAARTPAVPIRRSIHRDYVVCLECGWRGQMLRRHIATAHGLTVEQYRARWNLQSRAPDHRAQLFRAPIPGQTDRPWPEPRRVRETQAVPEAETETATPSSKRRETTKGEKLIFRPRSLHHARGGSV